MCIRDSSIGVEDQGVHQLQNILLAADVRQRVVPHGLLEVDEVQAFDTVSLALQQGSYLVQDGAFRVLSIRNKKRVSCF